MYAPIREEGAAPRDLWPKNRDGIIGRTSRATGLGYGAYRVATNRSALARAEHTMFHGRMSVCQYIVRRVLMYDQ